MTHRLAPLMAPRSIAVLGASQDLARISGVALKCLGDWDFAGPIYPVNPKYGEIAGRRCYPDVESLTEPVDLAIIAVNADRAVEQVRRAGARGVRAAVIYASGFEEMPDEEGQARGAALVAAARETGIVVCGPNCLGGVNVRDRVYTSFVPRFLQARPGEVALLTQSGNMGTLLFQMAHQVGLGCSHLVTTGNETVVEFSEYLEYLLDDPATEAVLGYVEALRDGDRFLRVARAFRERGKLLALLKAGRTAKGAEAARSHTAALAGDARAFAAACRAAGVAVAEDTQHLLDLGYMHRFRGRRRGRNAALITPSGAVGAIMSDGLTSRGMSLPTLPEATQDVLRQVVPSYGMVGNPVDITGNIMNSIEQLGDVVSGVLAAPELDQVLMYLPGVQLQRALPMLSGAAGRSDKLLVALDTGLHDNRAIAEKEGLAFFSDMTWCARALASYADWAAADLPAVPAGTRGDAPPDALTLLRGAAGTAQLSEAEGKRLLALCGIAPVPEAVVRTRQEAVAMAERFGWPVVAKIASPDIAHKTEVGGVRLNLRDAAALEHAFDAILDGARRHAPSARIDGVSIQPHITDGVELLLGATRDPVFGWMLTIGLGGVWTELMGDVVHAIAPVSVAEAEALLRGLKGFALLDGYRGAQKADLRAAAEAASALLSAVLALQKHITEVEVNPLLVRPAGQGAVAADALVLLRMSE